jgi:hypothetical protein
VLGSRQVLELGSKQVLVLVLGSKQVLELGSRQVLELGSKVLVLGSMLPSSCSNQTVQRRPKEPLQSQRRRSTSKPKSFVPSVTLVSKGE